jgi:putative drug exporter of the RND superfamily
MPSTAPDERRRPGQQWNRFADSRISTVTLTKVVESQTVEPLPPQAMAAAEQMAEDFDALAHNTVIVVLTDKQGLRPADEDVYRKLATAPRVETRDGYGV